ncbi:MAG: type II toxin-antitoxin system PemK/MazF family toxin [Anaerolineae bacterium]|uniref:type II toxin-antitoxin system PemK/MazF family toxin n=1 Tax=Candidatus Amarolinea dominans TaxID=3140696 RepID=UPI003135FB25|nr:type II toxin-antitoxin system PemK/MazF family toxin [Anaerolineae bacterium]
MKQAGQVVLFRFPQTNLTEAKPRPALLLGKIPGAYEDWLLCMISTQLHHYVPGFDEIARAGDADFASSGLKQESVIRVGRLAVVESNVLLGAIGQIAPNRLQRIKNHLADWLTHF